VEEANELRGELKEKKALAAKASREATAAQDELAQLKGSRGADEARWLQQIYDLETELASATRVKDDAVAQSQALREAHKQELQQAHLSSQQEVQRLKLKLGEQHFAACSPADAIVDVKLREMHHQDQAALTRAKEQLQSMAELESEVEKLRVDNERLTSQLAKRRHAIAEAEENERELTDLRREMQGFVEVARSILSRDRAPVAAELGLAFATLQKEIQASKAAEERAREERDEARSSARRQLAQQQEQQREVTLLKSQLSTANTSLAQLEAQVTLWKARANPKLAADGGSMETTYEDTSQALGAKDATIQQLTDEVNTMRAELTALQDVSAVVTQLEQRLEEAQREITKLQTTRDELEKQLGIVESEVAKGSLDTTTTKVLRCKLNPSDSIRKATFSALRSENEELKERLVQLQQGAAVDPLEVSAGLQAKSIEAEKWKKKYDISKQHIAKMMRTFREGLSTLLGWHIDIEGTGRPGDPLTWCFRSKYGSPDDVLIFQRETTASREEKQFNLLDSAWARRLQEDDKALVYLTAFQSIPGFLGYITIDMVSRQSFS